MNPYDAISRARDATNMCDDGAHDWEAVGGRKCPHNFTENCSQAVYRCAGCDAWDYGDTSGPGHRDCTAICHVAAIRNGETISRQRRRSMERQAQKHGKPETVQERPDPHPNPIVKQVTFAPCQHGEEPEIVVPVRFGRATNFHF